MNRQYCRMLDKGIAEEAIPGEFRLLLVVEMDDVRQQRLRLLHDRIISQLGAGEILFGGILITWVGYILQDHSHRENDFLVDVRWEGWCPSTVTQLIQVADAG